MAESNIGLLTRDEAALLNFYRGLPFEKQFELLEEAEGSFNAARRMEFLRGRDTERPLNSEDFH